MAFTPQTAGLTFRRDLSQVAREFDDTLGAQLFMARLMAPELAVPEVAATYPVWTRENFKKNDESSNRNEHGGYQRIDAEFSSLNYTTEEHGLEFKLDDRRMARFRTFLDFEQHATRVLRYKHLQKLEIRVRTLFETTMGLTNTNVATAWTTTGSAVPISDIHTAADKITQKTGIPREQLELFIPTVDFDEMMLTDNIIDLVQNTFARNQGVRPQNLREADVAHMMGIKAVHKLASYFDSADEGQAESNSAIWTEGVMYLGIFSTGGAGLESMSPARTFVFDADGGPDIPIMERYRDETVRSDILRIRDDTDEAITAETDLFVQKITNT